MSKKQNEEEELEAYTFLDLSERDIAYGLNEVGLQYSANSLMKPTTKETIQVLRSFLLVMTSITEEEIVRPHFRSDVEVDEEFSKGIAFLNFFRLLQELMITSSINDFTLHDLIKPNSKRLIHILSGLINFAKFREIRLEKFKQLSDERNELVLQNDEIVKMIDELNKQIELKRIENQEREEEETDLKSQQIDLQHQLTEIEIEIAKTDSESNKMKKQMTEAQNEAKLLKQENLRKSQLILDKKEMLDFDEERMKQLAQQTQENLQIEILQYEQNEKYCEDLEAKKEFFSQNVNKLAKALDEIVPILQNTKKEQKVKHDLDDSRKELQKKIDELNQLKGQQEAKKNKIQADEAQRKELIKKIKQQKKTNQQKKDERESSLHEFHHKLEALNNDFKAFRQLIHEQMDMYH